MNLKTETRTIEGLQVRTQQLPAMRSFSLFTRLGKIIAPVLAKLSGVGDITLKTDISALAPVIGELFNNIDSEQSASLAREILALTSVVYDGKNVALSGDIAIDSVFTGRFKAFLLTLAFALQVNYQDFFVDALGSGLPSADTGPPENQQEDQSG